MTRMHLLAELELGRRRDKEEADKEPVPSDRPALSDGINREELPDEGRLAAILMFAILATVLTVYWMTKVGYPERLLTDVDAMKATPQWVVWVVIISMQAAVWAALLGPIAAATKKANAPRSKGLFFYAVLVVVLLALPVLSNVLFERPHAVQEAFAVRLRVLTTAGSIVGLIAAIGILRTGREIRTMELPAKPGVVEVNRYLDARRRLLFLGGALAAIVALAILVTGGLRNTIVAMETTRATKDAALAETVIAEDFVDGSPSEEQQAAAEAAASEETSRLLKSAAAASERSSRFGLEVVWAFGLYYSFALVLVFLPAYFWLTAYGRKLRDRLQPGLLPSDPGFETSKKARDELDQLLQLKGSRLQSLRAASLVLVPVATGLASSLLGGADIPA